MAAQGGSQGPPNDDFQDWTNRFTKHLENISTEIHSKSDEGANSWQASLFECWQPIDLAAITWCLPCVTFGKTYHRTRRNAKMEDYSAVNPSCLLLCGTSCFALQWIPLWMQRAEIRRKYGLKGDCLTDLLLSCFCGCCSLVQQEKETLLLEEKEAQRQYESQAAGMVYQPGGKPT